MITRSGTRLRRHKLWITCGTPKCASASCVSSVHLVVFGWHHTSVQPPDFAFRCSFLLCRCERTYSRNLVDVSTCKAQHGAQCTKPHRSVTIAINNPFAMRGNVSAVFLFRRFMCKRVQAHHSHSSPMTIHFGMCTNKSAWRSQFKGAERLKLSQFLSSSLRCNGTWIKCVCFGRLRTCAVASTRPEIVGAFFRSVSFGFVFECCPES